MNIITSEWYTIPETEAKLKVTEKTLRRWAAQGRLGYRLQSIPGKRPQRIYNAADVEGLRLSGPSRIVVAQHTPEAPRHAVLVQKQIDQNDGHDLDAKSMVGQFLDFMKAEHEAKTERAKIVREDARRRWELRQKQHAETNRVWLTLKESAGRSGLPRLALRQAVKDGKLVASTAGGIRIQRASLDSFKG